MPCAPALAAIDRYMFVEKAVMTTMGIIEQCSRTIRHTVGPCMPFSDMSTRTISDLSLSDRQRDTASVPSVTDHMTAAVFTDEPVERLQANAVVYSAARHEAWLFGDCQIMVNGEQIPTVKHVDELLGELRAFTVLALRSKGEHQSPAVAATDPARAMILPFLRLQSQFANKRGPYGYFVFDGFTDPTYPIRTVNINPGDEVVLASDGYPCFGHRSRNPNGSCNGSNARTRNSSANISPPKVLRRATIRSMTAPICDSSHDPVFSSFLGAVKQQMHDGVGHDHVAEGAGVEAVDGPESLRVDLIGMGQVKEGDVARLAQSPAHGGLRADAAFDVAAQRARRAAE